MTGADVVARILKAEGVEQVFCFPLSGLMEALSAHGLRVITTRQERVAGNMADGLSRSTNGRRIGVVAVQALAGGNAVATIIITLVAIGVVVASLVLARNERRRAQDMAEANRGPATA